MQPQYFPQRLVERRHGRQRFDVGQGLRCAECGLHLGAQPIAELGSAAKLSDDAFHETLNSEKRVHPKQKGDLLGDVFLVGQTGFAGKRRDLGKILGAFHESQKALIDNDGPAIFRPWDVLGDGGKHMQENVVV